MFKVSFLVCRFVSPSEGIT